MTTAALAAACDLQIKVPPYQTRIAVSDRADRRERYANHGRLVLTWAQLTAIDASGAAAIRRLLAATDQARAVLLEDAPVTARAPVRRQVEPRAAPAQLRLDRVV